MRHTIPTKVLASVGYLIIIILITVYNIILSSPIPPRRVKGRECVGSDTHSTDDKEKRESVHRSVLEFDIRQLTYESLLL